MAIDLFVCPVSVSDVKVGKDETAMPAVVPRRLREEQRAWMTTLRVQDGSLHVSPVWFVYQPGCWWVSAQARSVKVHDLECDPRVALALEDGVNPVVAEGRARVHHDEFPGAIVQCFATQVRRLGYPHGRSSSGPPSVDRDHPNPMAPSRIGTVTRSQTRSVAVADPITGQRSPNETARRLPDSDQASAT